MRKPYLTEKYAESREFTRFILKGNSLVSLPGMGRLGSIKDISLGGLSCELTVSLFEAKGIKWQEATELSADILVSGSESRFHLPGIQCRLTYDVSVPESRSTLDSRVSKRRCGLKFDQLTENQENGITRFLRKHGL
jgi:hypothetical protein